MTKLTARSRLGMRGINGKIRVRILRPWRGYKAGDVITPPGALRTELLRKKDQLGNKFAELAGAEPTVKQPQPQATKPSAPKPSKPKQAE